MASLITLTTDFGPGSVYVAQMKGVMLSVNPQATLVDIAHNIPPQNIRQAAQLLAELPEWYPAGTIHVAVVDPGVGTRRQIIYARIAKQHFIAPDNGLLSLLLKRKEAEQILTLTNPKYWLPNISSTFHGRDIMAPAAAHLSLGLKPENLGERCEKVFRLVWPDVEVQERQLDGMIISFDTFGNLITDITAEMLPEGGAFQVHCGKHAIRGLVETYADNSPGTLVALFGSSRFLELAVVKGNAAKKLRVDVGEKVTVSW